MPLNHMMGNSAYFAYSISHFLDYLHHVPNLTLHCNMDKQQNVVLGILYIGDMVQKPL